MPVLLNDLKCGVVLDVLHKGEHPLPQEVSGSVTTSHRDRKSFATLVGLPDPKIIQCDQNNIDTQSEKKKKCISIANLILVVPCNKLTHLHSCLSTYLQ